MSPLPSLEHQTICSWDRFSCRFKVADKMRQRSTSCLLITWQPTNYGFLLAFSFFPSLLSFRNANKSRDCLNSMGFSSSYCKWNLEIRGTFRILNWKICSMFHGNNYSAVYFTPLRLVNAKHHVLDVSVFRSNFNWMYCYQCHKILPHYSIEADTRASAKRLATIALVQ